MRTEDDQIIDHIHYQWTYWWWYTKTFGPPSPEHALPNPEAIEKVKIQMFHHEVEVTLN